LEQDSWTNELSWTLSLLAVCAGTGFLLDLFWPALSAGALVCVARNLRHSRRMHEWLESGGRKDPPESPGLWGAISDRIYGLQRNEQEVRQSLEEEIAYFRDSLTSLSDCVVMINQHGGIDWCNPAAIRLFGFVFPQDHNQHILHLLRDPAFVRYFDGGDYSGTVEISSPIDRERILLVQVTRFGRGNRLLFARDVTEIHKLEVMRRDFVSNVSHELRTPLTVISGYIDTFALLADADLRLQKPLLQMSEHARRMETLIRDLLELSRLETVGRDLHGDTVDLAGLMQQIVDEAKASLPDGQSREITVSCEKGIQLVGKRSELHSAFLNLVVNACKYTANNGRIDVTGRRDEKGVVFSVRDNGIGIDEVDIPRLTERFYRVDKSRSVDTGGTGLGLAIVKKVLQRHDAELVITSTLGRGSCFSCRFPPSRVL
jgi:two-component system phosphate regulon sensor histidine kinase PhoR